MGEFDLLARVRERLPPPGARVHFSGVDPQAGPLLKYTIVEPHGTAH